MGAIQKLKQMDNKTYNERSPSDLGYTIGLQDAIDALREAFKDADTEKTFHYRKITDGVSIGEAYTHHRSRYEFYDGKCDAYAEAIKALKANLESINKEYVVWGVYV